MLHQETIPTASRAVGPARHLSLTTESDECWRRVKGRLRSRVGEDAYLSWFQRMDLESVGAGRARLSVPTRFLKTWILQHYSEALLVCCMAELPDVDRFDLSVREFDRAAETMALVKRPSLDLKEAPSMAAASRSVDPIEQMGLLPEPRFTFATFKIGSQNQVAHAAAAQVAEHMASAPLLFNPLAIHGGHGLGKTHLLHAIAHHWGSRAVLLSAERFLSLARDSAGQALLSGACASFEIFLIDDVHLLSVRQSQAQLAHVVQNLQDRRKQVVVAADSAARDLETFDPRLKDRLCGGLEVEIGAQEYGLRLDIVRSRASAIRATHNDFAFTDEIAEYIATSLQSGGREIDGVMNRIAAEYIFARQQITMEVAERVVAELRHPVEPKRIRIEDIQRVVCRYYNVTRGDLLSARRTKDVVRPRQIAMYLCRKLTLRSLPEIGRRFGNRDHTTGLHACRKMEGLAQSNPEIAAEFAQLEQIILEV